MPLAPITSGSKVLLQHQNEVRDHLRGVVEPVDDEGNPGTAGTGYGSLTTPVGRVVTQELYVGDPPEQVQFGAAVLPAGVASGPAVPGLEGTVGHLGINSSGNPFIRGGTVLRSGGFETEFAADVAIPAPPAGADQTATVLAVVNTAVQWGYNADFVHSQLTGGWLPVFGNPENGAIAVGSRPCCAHVHLAFLPDTGAVGERRLTATAGWVLWDGDSWEPTGEVLIGVIEYSSVTNNTATKVMPVRTQAFQADIERSLPPGEVDAVSGLTTSRVLDHTVTNVFNCRQECRYGSGVEPGRGSPDCRTVCDSNTRSIYRYDANRDSEPVYGYTQLGLQYLYGAAPITGSVGATGNVTRTEASLAAGAITEELYYGATHGYFGWGPPITGDIHYYLPAVGITAIRWVARGSTV